MSEGRAYLERMLVGAVMHGRDQFEASIGADTLILDERRSFVYLGVKRAYIDGGPTDPATVIFKLAGTNDPDDADTALDFVGGEKAIKALYRAAKDFGTPEKTMELVQALRATPAPNGTGSDADDNTPKPIRCSDRDLPEITAEVLAALEIRNEDAPRLFVRGLQLVRVVSQSEAVDGQQFRRPVINPLSEAALRGEMARVASYTTLIRDSWRLTSPPLDVVRDVASLDSWPFPNLAGLVEQPVIRPDGSILDSAGYDPATGLYYWPSPGLLVPQVSEQPSDAELAAAVELIDEAIHDFPWADDAARANVIGLMLTPLIRHAIKGAQVPGGAIDAPESGTGKGLLNEVVSRIATGRAGYLMPPTESEEEMRKRITAALLQGDNYLIIDNVEKPLASAALNVAMTADTWSDRVLGASRNVKIPVRVTWSMTGNNIQLRGDLRRRWYRIRLNAKVADPTKRTGFLHPDLLRWVSTNRGRLLAALLTLVRSWYAAGCPVATVPVFGGFERWSETVGSILVNARIKGFLTNLDSFREEQDDDGRAWAAFLEGWQQRFGEAPLSTKVVVDKLRTDEGFRELLPESLSDRWGEKGFPSSFGQHLRGRKERRFGDPPLWVEKGSGQAHGSGNMWVVRVSNGRAELPQLPHGGQLELESGRGDGEVSGRTSPHFPTLANSKRANGEVGEVSSGRSPVKANEEKNDGYDPDAFEALVVADEAPPDDLDEEDS